LWSGLGGVILVEAAKDMAQPVAVGKVARARVGGPVAARPAISAARASERKAETQ
jgi:hypothetical protein